MSSTKQKLLALAEALANHENVSLWAISMRFLNKGDFFVNLQSGKRKGCTSDTSDRLFQAFSDHWPCDLEWPDGISRPARSGSEDAA